MLADATVATEGCGSTVRAAEGVCPGVRIGGCIGVGGCSGVGGCIGRADSWQGAALSAAAAASASAAAAFAATSAATSALTSVAGGSSDTPGAAAAAVVTAAGTAATACCMSCARRHANMCLIRVARLSPLRSARQAEHSATRLQSAVAGMRH